MKKLGFIDKMILMWRAWLLVGIVLMALYFLITWIVPERPPKQGGDAWEYTPQQMVAQINRAARKTGAPRFGEEQRDEHGGYAYQLGKEQGDIVLAVHENGDGLVYKVEVIYAPDGWADEERNLLEAYLKAVERVVSPSGGIDFRQELKLYEDAGETIEVRGDGVRYSHEGDRIVFRPL